MSGLITWLESWWTPEQPDNSENMMARPRLRSREREVQRIAREISSESPPPRRVILWARDEYQHRMDDEQFEREFQAHMNALHKYSERQGAYKALKGVHLQLSNMEKHNAAPRPGDWPYKLHDAVELVRDAMGSALAELSALRGDGVVQEPCGVVKRRDRVPDDHEGGQNSGSGGDVQPS